MKAILAAHHSLCFPTPPAAAKAPALLLHPNPDEIPSPNPPDSSSDGPESPDPLLSDPLPLPDPALYSPTKRARVMNILLEKTSANHLAGSLDSGSDGSIPNPVYERLHPDLYPDWFVIRKVPPLTTSAVQKTFNTTVLTELGRAKAFSGALVSALEASNAQLVLAHLEIQRLRTLLNEVKAEGRRSNKWGKLMSSGMARLLTSEEFRAAITKDEEVAAAEVARKAATAKSRGLSKAKREWRARDVAARKLLKLEIEKRWLKAQDAAKAAGGRKPLKPRAPVRPKTPDDAFFEVDIEDQESIHISDVSGDEDDED